MTTLSLHTTKRWKTIFSIIFAIMLSFSSFFWLEIQVGEQTLNWSETIGKITFTDIVESFGEDESTTYTIIIRYSYIVNNIKYNSSMVAFDTLGNILKFDSKNDAQSFLENYPEGSLITVYYDPKNPSLSVLIQGPTISSVNGYKITFILSIASFLGYLITLSPNLLLILEQRRLINEIYQNNLFTTNKKNIHDEKNKEIYSNYQRSLTPKYRIKEIINNERTITKISRVGKTVLQPYELLIFLITVFFMWFLLILQSKESFINSNNDLAISIIIAINKPLESFSLYDLLFIALLLTFLWIIDIIFTKYSKKTKISVMKTSNNEPIDYLTLKTFFAAIGLAVLLSLIPLTFFVCLIVFYYVSIGWLIPTILFSLVIVNSHLPIVVTISFFLLGIIIIERFLASLYRDSVIFWYKFPSESLTFSKIFLDHKKEVYCLAKNEKYFFSGSSDKTISIRSLEEGKKVVTLKGHKGAITALIATDKVLYSASTDGKINVWNINKMGAFQIITTLESNYPSPITSLHLTKSHLYVGTSDGRVIVWSLKGFNKYVLLNDFQAHIYAVNSIQTSDYYLFTCSNDNTVKIWSIDNDDYHLIDALTHHTKEVTGLVYNNGFLVTASLDKTIGLVTITDGKIELIKKINVDTPIHQLYYYQPDPIIFAALNNGTIIYWINNIFKSELTNNIDTHASVIETLMIDNYYLYAGFIDGTVRIYNIREACN